jgi:hypothetical protein
VGIVDVAGIPEDRINDFVLLYFPFVWLSSVLRRHLATGSASQFAVRLSRFWSFITTDRLGPVV